MIAFIIGGLIGAAAWFFLARSCLRRQELDPDHRHGAVRPGHGGYARRLGAPMAGAVKIWWPLLVWLVGLTAIVFLWRRTSTEFFKGPRRRMIELDRLSKRFGSVTALDALSFTVRPGHVTGFLGPNGAGKTTTMRDHPRPGRPDQREQRLVNGQPLRPS